MRTKSLLPVLLRQGPYTSLAMAEERVEQLDADEVAETLRLDAIRRLKTAVDRAKAMVLGGHLRTRGGTGHRHSRTHCRPAVRRVQLGEGMSLASVRPEGCNTSAPIKQMSAGEQEQIYFRPGLCLRRYLPSRSGNCWSSITRSVTLTPNACCACWRSCRKGAAVSSSSSYPAIPNAIGNCRALWLDE